MKVAGIVAEYNPFHNGHKFQIDTLRQMGFTHIVSAMSGNFVQRGDAAIADKWVRTACALSNGVDLVFEIPTAFCLAPAEKYCSYAVEMLNTSKIIDCLCFGSESANIDLLSEISNVILCDSAVNDALKSNLNAGINFSAAREKAVKELYGKNFSDVLRNPNDILAIEYLKALNNLNSNIKPIAIKRQKIGHNDNKTTEDFASASKIRELIDFDSDYSKFMPKNAFSKLKAAEKENSFPVALKNRESIILYSLRTLSEHDFESLQDISEGLNNRLYNVAVKKACSLESLYELSKTKRYTLAKIRRLILNACLRIYNYQKPPYLKVLGFSKNGEVLLKKLKECSDLPIISSYSDAKKLSDEAKLYFEKEADYTDFYSMLLPEIKPKGLEYSKSIVKI